MEHTPYKQVLGNHIHIEDVETQGRQELEMITGVYHRSIQVSSTLTLQSIRNMYKKLLKYI